MGFKPMYAEKFPETPVCAILQNDKYAGDLRMQQVFMAFPNATSKVKNEGQLPTYIMENAHEALISKEIFAKAQAGKEDFWAGVLLIPSLIPLCLLLE